MIIFSNSISNKIFTFDYRDPSCMNDFVKGKLIVEKFFKMYVKNGHKCTASGGKKSDL